VTKYVIKVGSKYLTSYGNLTENVCCADKYKYREDAEEVAEENGGVVEEVVDEIHH